jgi:hypothetical protein
MSHSAPAASANGVGAPISPGRVYVPRPGMLTMDDRWGTHVPEKGHQTTLVPEAAA